MRDGDGSVPVAAEVVVADAGVVPGEFIAVKDVFRRIDVDISAGVALREDVGVAARVVGASFEELVTRRLRAVLDSGVVRRLFTQDEPAVDEHSDIACEFREFRAVGLVRRGQSLSRESHIRIRREVLIRVVERAAEVAVGDVGEQVAGIDAEGGEGDFQRTAERRRRTRGIAQLIAAILGDLARRRLDLGQIFDDEGVLVDFVARLERDLDLHRAGEHLLVRIAVDVHDSDAGGQVGIAGVGHFDDLTVSPVRIAADVVGEPSGLRDKLECVGQDDLGVDNDALIDDDGDNRLIEVAVRVLEGGDVVRIPRARERESRVGGELVAPAHDVDGDLSAVREFHLERVALDFFGLPGLLIDLVISQRGTVRRDERAESAVFHGIDGHCAVGGGDDLRYDAVHRRGVAAFGSAALHRTVHFLVVGEGDEDVGVHGLAGGGDGEMRHVGGAGGVIDKAVPIELRLHRRAVGLHHGAALGHRAVELRRGGDGVSHHAVLLCRGAAVREHIGVGRGSGGGSGGCRPLEAALLSYGYGDGDRLRRSDKAHVATNVIVHFLHLIRGGVHHPHAFDIDEEVIRKAAHVLPRAADAEVGLLQLLPDIEPAHIHGDVDGDIPAGTSGHRVEQLGEIPSHHGVVAAYRAADAVRVDEVAALDVEVLEILNDRRASLCQSNVVGETECFHKLAPAAVGGFEVGIRIFVAALHAVDECGGDGQGDIMRLCGGEAPLIADAYGDGLAAVRAVPAVVKPVEIPRECAHGQSLRIGDVCTAVAQHSIRCVAHDYIRPVGVGCIGRIDGDGVGVRLGVLDVDVIETKFRSHRDIAFSVRRCGGLEHVDRVAVAQHRIERIAREFVHSLLAEHIAIAVAEPDVDEVVRDRGVAARPVEGDRSTLAAVAHFIDTLEVLAVRDVDGDHRHDEVQSIAVDIARKPVVFLKRGGAEVQRTRIPDEDDILLRRGADKVHSCRLRQAESVHQPITVERACADNIVAVVSRRALGADVINDDLINGQRGLRRTARFEQFQHSLAFISLVVGVDHQIARVDGKHPRIHHVLRSGTLIDGVVDLAFACNALTVRAGVILHELSAVTVLLRIDHEFDRLDAWRDLLGALSVEGGFGRKVDVEVERRIDRIRVHAGKGRQQRRNKDGDVTESRSCQCTNTGGIVANNPITHAAYHIIEQPFQQAQGQAAHVRIEQLHPALRLLLLGEIVHIGDAVQLFEEVGDDILSVAPHMSHQHSVFRTLIPHVAALVGEVIHPRCIDVHVVMH